MATTTNYGWTTPDDTALVKDGAAAIRTLGSSVDTTTKNLNPETTLGDIVYRSSTANVKTRLGIGSSGQVLTVSGGVPAWSTISAGGMTLLSTTTLSGATTDITGIDQTYNSLFIVVDQVTISADSRLVISPNSLSGVYAVGFGNASTTAIALTNADLQLTGSTSNLVKGTGANNAFSVTIDNYASTTNYKPIRWFGTYENASTTVSTNFAGGIALDNAVSSLLFYPVGTFNGGTVRIYGVK